jgi:hypothetical protein
MYTNGAYGFPIGAYYAKATPVGPVQYPGPPAFKEPDPEQLYPINGATPESPAVPVQPVQPSLFQEIVPEALQAEVSEIINSIEQAEAAIGISPMTGNILFGIVVCATLYFLVT